MIIAPLILAVQLSVSPAAPAVGDPVTLTPTDGSRIGSIAPSDCAEIIEQQPDAIIVRSFVVGECTVRFTLESNRSVVHEAAFEVRSVLTEEDPAPSPYRPPLEIPVDRRAWWSVGLAGLAALVTWILVFRRRVPEPEAASTAPSLPPLDELLGTAAALAQRSGPEAQIQAADAVRRYLERTDPRLTLDRTTGEVLRWFSRRRDPRIEPLSQILAAGDRAKFAPEAARTELRNLSEWLHAFIDLELERRDRIAG